VATKRSKATEADFQLAQALSVAAERAVGRRPCKLCEILEKMPSARADIIRAGIRSEVGIIRLTNILQDHGVLVGRPTVARHREEGHTA
jgi:hypothetical protein